MIVGQLLTTEVVDLVVRPAIRIAYDVARLGILGSLIAESVLRLRWGGHCRVGATSMIVAPSTGLAFVLCQAECEQKKRWGKKQLHDGRVCQVLREFSLCMEWP